MRKIYAFMVLGAVVVLTGCETVKGVGRDIQNLGGGIQTAVTRPARDTA